MKEGIVAGEAFAVDGSMIVADAHRRRGVAKVEDLDPASAGWSRSICLRRPIATRLQPTPPPFMPVPTITSSMLRIVDVEATMAIRRADVGAAKTMLDRTAERFDLTPSRLVADAGYGSAEMLGWQYGIGDTTRHRAERTDGTFSRSDFQPARRRRGYRY
jgi:hypothetical protein